MAVYSTSSSGNLKIANTGLTSPVSFFAYNSLASAPIAAGPVVGQQSVVWTVQGFTPTVVTSAGSLKLANYLATTQNGLSANTLGEFPLGGSTDTFPTAKVEKGFVSGVIQSSGSLKLTGSTASIKAYNLSSAGDLKISGSTTARITVQRTSAGSTKLTGSTLARAIFKTQSAGSLKLAGTDVDNEILKISSAGQLNLSGSNITYKRYNKFTAGNLKTTGTYSNVITWVPTSSGTLSFATGYYDPTYLGGIATNALASNLDDLPATLRTTVTSFFGSNISSGALKITPYGEVVSLLSHSSGIAGSALTEDALAAGLDTIRRESTYTTLYNISSIGSLHIQGPSTAIQYDNDTAGDIVLSGATVPAFIRGFNTFGNLTSTGANVTVRTLHFNSDTGTLTLPDLSGYVTPILSSSSGIAGSALAEQPIGSGIDLYKGFDFVRNLGFDSTGSLDTTGYHVVDRTLHFDSAGYLTVSGVDVFEELEQLTSAGNLKVAGNNITVRTLHFDSGGNLYARGTDGFTTRPLSDSSSIAGSSIASIPIGGGSDYYRVDEWNRTLGFNSSGALVASGTTGFAKRLDFLSSGNLTIIGITGSGQQNLADSFGSIKITGSSIGVRTLNFDSDTGTLTLPDLSGYVTPILSSSSGIAGSAIAEQPISSGIDSYKGFDFVRNLGFNSTGSLSETGNTGFNKTLDFLSSGYLTVSGVDVFEELEQLTSAGNLKVAGSTISVRTLHFDSNGKLYVGNTNGFTTRPLSDSSSIAGSSIASTPVGGASDYYEVYEWNKALGFNSSGSLHTSGAFRFSKTLDFLSSGSLTIVGNTGSGQQNLADSAGNLVMSGTNVTVRTLNFKTAGSTKLYKDGYQVNDLTSGAGIAFGSIAGETLSGTGADEFRSVYTSLAHGRQTAGLLTLNGYDIPTRTLDFSTSGQILLSGSTLFSRTRIANINTSTAKLSGSSYSNISWTPDSFGVLSFKELTLSTQSGIASSALGEFPLAGTVDNLNKTSIQYVKGSPAVLSSGVLSVTGNTVIIVSRLETSAGELTIGPADEYRIRWTESTAGRLVLNGTKTVTDIFAPKSAGQLKLSSNAIVFRTIIKATTSGILYASGTNITYKRYNKDTTGLLDLITDTLYHISINGRTAGRLQVKDHSIKYNNITSGASIGDNTIAAGALAGQEPTNVEYIRTIVNFNSITPSAGQLRISAVGSKLVTDVSALASSPIASSPVSGSTPYSTKTARVSYISKGVRYTDNIFYVSSIGSIKLSGLSRSGYTVGGVSVGGGTFIATSSGRLVLTMTSANKFTLNEKSTGRIKLIGSSVVEAGSISDSKGHLAVYGSSTISAKLTERSTGSTKVTGSSAYQVITSTTSSGSVVTSGTHLRANVFVKQSSGNAPITADDSYNSTLNKDSSGQSTVTTESKYNITAIVDSIGSMGVLGSLEEFTAIKKRSSGTIKLSGQSKIVISLKPGSLGYIKLTGGAIITPVLNKENMGGSGIYYGPWGAPFVLPFAKEYEEVKGKRKRKVRRIAIAVRFGKAEQWERTHYDLGKLQKGVTVSASTPSVVTNVPKDNRPKITVNASAFRLLQSNNIDVSNITVVESEKVKAENFVNKETVVETGSIKESNFKINVTLDDTTGIKVTAGSLKIKKPTVEA